MAGDTQQLIKKRSQGVGYMNIYPKTYIELVSDRLTNQLLSDILARFNFLYLVYDGDASNTRLQVEAQYRRKGLWIAYVRTDGTLITEYSISDNIDDETWSSDTNWQSSTTAQIDIKSLEPEDLTLELEKITFANRAYDPSTYSGKGYTILRKNIQTVPSAGTVNLLTQDMINDPNTVYEIRYDFNLNGATINIPEGSVLDFKGGSLGNGTIIGSATKLNLKSGYLINLNLSGSYDIEYISYRYFKNYLDDTALVSAMFNLLFNNVSKSTLDLEPDRLYDIYSETLVGYAASIYEYTNVRDKRINGNSAVFNDLRTRAQMGTTRYDGILGLNNSHNIQILYLNYQNLNEDYDLPTQIGYIGSSFILLNSDCSNIEVVSNIIGARYGIKSGSYSQYWLCGSYGIKNSIFNVTAYKCGYPVSIEVGEDLDITISSDTHHRAAYLCGISNSSVYIEAKDNYIAPLHCLLSDSRYSDTQGSPKFKACSDLNVVVKDKGTSNSSSAGDRYLCGFQTYNTYTERTNALVWENINITCVKEVESNLIGLFSFQRVDSNESPMNIADVYNNIHIKGLDMNSSTQYAARISPSSYAIYNNVDFEVIAPKQRVIYANYNSIFFRLKNSVLASLNYAGNLFLDSCTVTNVLKYSSQDITTFNTKVLNSSVNINTSNADTCEADFGSLLSTSPSTTPLGNPDRPSIVIDSSLRVPKVWNKTAWKRYDGFNLYPSTGGAYPSLTQGEDRGFQFYNTVAGNRLGIWDGYYWKHTPLYRVDNFVGTTVERPTNVSSASVFNGVPYFDIDLNRPIWWKGSQWIDSSGNPADALKTGTTEQRPTGVQIGFIYKDTTLDQLAVWDGIEWKPFYSGVPQSDSEFIVNV